MDGVRLAAAAAGFLLLLVSSAALERLRLHSLAAELPLAPGGLIGEASAAALSGALGFTGATLALLTAAAIGFSLFVGVSWLTIFEIVGRFLERGYLAVLGAWERRRDRKLGSLARVEREAVVEHEKRREEEHPPLRIEPALGEIKKSERVHKEKQAPLFEHLPDTPLPPLKLLDEAAGGGESIARRDPGIHLAADREEALRLRRRGEGAGGLPRAGDHALRDRAGGWSQGQPDRQPGEGPGARAVGGVDPGGRDHPRQVVHGARDPQSAPPDGAPVRDPRLRGLPRAAFAARARARQGHRRSPGRRRPRAHAAPARRRHHRLGQVGRAERDDPVARSTSPSCATCG